MSVHKRVLVVGDDPSILAGLHNLLHKDRKRWDIVFVPGGQLASTRSARRRSTL